MKTCDKENAIMKIISFISENIYYSLNMVLLQLLQDHRQQVRQLVLGRVRVLVQLDWLLLSVLWLLAVMVGIVDMVGIVSFCRSSCYYCKRLHQ